MTFENIEQSVDRGSPVYLFLIRYGADDLLTFRYTDHTEDIDYLGLTYEPVAIRRSAFESTTTLDNSNISIDIALDAPVVDYLFTNTPTQRLSLIVRSGHLDDPDDEFVVDWSGVIVGIQDKDSAYATLGCESVVTMLRRGAMNRNYQRGCPWALYEPYCNAPRTVQSTRIPVVIGSNVVVVSGAWNGSIDKSKYKGGYISWTPSTISGTHQRTILDVLSHTQGDSLLLQGRTDGLTAGTRISIFAGCNHQPNDCREIHNNVANYGGQWSIPLDNPVSGVNRFF